MRKETRMSILTQNSALRPLLFGALLGSAWLAACSSDKPGIADGKAGSSQHGEEGPGGEDGLGGSGGQAIAGSSAQAGGGSSAGSQSNGVAGEPVASTGGTTGDPDPMGAAGEPSMGEAGADGNGEPPVVGEACIFHTAPPPPIEGAGGDGTGPDTIVVQTSPFIGTYLTDAAGRTLYTYGSDVPGDCNTVPVSNCAADCPVSWPIFDAGQRGLGAGLDDANFGTITRSDGLSQTTYFGWPLYYYKNDLTLGQLTGQGKAKTWHAAEVVPPSIVVMKAGTAKYLATGAGHTLYVSDADQAGSTSEDPVSNCEQDCLATFEPFHLKTISAVTSLETSDFEVFVRQGHGGLQLAFKGRPLYIAKTDTIPGAMHGAEISGFAAAILP
jgi:predicted lipoprotein with Yx(FWY)xxD motif